METIKIIEDCAGANRPHDRILVMYHLTTTFLRLFLYELTKKAEINCYVPKCVASEEIINTKDELISKRETAYNTYMNSLKKLKQMYPGMRDKKLLKLFSKFKNLELYKVQGVHNGCIVLLSMMEGSITKKEAYDKFEPHDKLESLNYFENMLRDMEKIAAMSLK